MRVAILILLIVGCLSCQNNNEKVSRSEIKVLDMYEPSEMANLMNAMYAYNLKVKNELLSNDSIGDFPNDFLKIHIAKMTKANGRNENFENFSKLFIQVEKELYNSESRLTKKERFNNAINVCISCHQQECTGPIPRIKKLLIQ